MSQHAKHERTLWTATITGMVLVGFALVMLGIVIDNPGNPLWAASVLMACIGGLFCLVGILAHQVYRIRVEMADHVAELRVEIVDHMTKVMHGMFSEYASTVDDFRHEVERLTNAVGVDVRLQSLARQFDRGGEPQ